MKIRLLKMYMSTLWKDQVLCHVHTVCNGLQVSPWLISLSGSFRMHITKHLNENVHLLCVILAELRPKNLECDFGNNGTAVLGALGLILVFEVVTQGRKTCIPVMPSLRAFWKTFFLGVGF